MSVANSNTATVPPTFDDLPSVKGMPQGCAWGIFDKQPGEKDLLGTLNLLTPEVIRRASTEIAIGHSVSLKFVSLTSYCYCLPRWSWD